MGASCDIAQEHARTVLPIGVPRQAPRTGRRVSTRFAPHVSKVDRCRPRLAEFRPFFVDIGRKLAYWTRVGRNPTADLWNTSSWRSFRSMFLSKFAACARHFCGGWTQCKLASVRTMQLRMARRALASWPRANENLQTLFRRTARCDRVNGAARVLRRDDALVASHGQATSLGYRYATLTA